MDDHISLLSSMLRSRYFEEALEEKLEGASSEMFNLALICPIQNQRIMFRPFSRHTHLRQNRRFLMKTIATTLSAPYSKAMWAILRVPTTLTMKASLGLLSISGTCL